MNISESILYEEDSFYNQKCLFSISTQILYYYIYIKTTVLRYLKNSPSNCQCNV